MPRPNVVSEPASVVVCAQSAQPLRYLLRMELMVLHRCWDHNHRVLWMVNSPMQYAEKSCPITQLKTTMISKIWEYLAQHIWDTSPNIDWPFWFVHLFVGGKQLLETNFVEFEEFFLEVTDKYRVSVCDNWWWKAMQLNYLIHEQLQWHVQCMSASLDWSEHTWSICQLPP